MSSTHVVCEAHYIDQLQGETHQSQWVIIMLQRKFSFFVIAYFLNLKLVKLTKKVLIKLLPI